MAVRKIVKIDEEKCNGCGLCVPSCAEGAIQVIEGKARLVNDIYCDGLGACLGDCPQDAITIEEREAEEFDEQKAHEFVENLNSKKATVDQSTPRACPGTAMRSMNVEKPSAQAGTVANRPSALGNWPLQLHLVPPFAPYFEDADILLAADCVPFAYAGFHQDMLAAKVLLIGCPKLDDSSQYIEKLSAILKNSSVKSLTVARMEVPCCTGLVRLAHAAMAESGKDLPVREMVVSIQGDLIGDR